jgi:hypothetical protein
MEQFILKKNLTFRKADFKAALIRIRKYLSSIFFAIRFLKVSAILLTEMVSVNANLPL